MKSPLTTLLALITVPALAYRPVYIDDKGEHLFKPSPPSSKSPGKHRHLERKGAKKGSLSPAFGNCKTLHLLAKIEDIIAGVQIADRGETSSFPFYDMGTMKEIGLFTDVASIMQDGECVFTGVLSTDYNEETSSFDSQMTITGTCSGAFNAITGGTGGFDCARGFQSFTEAPSENFYASTINICVGCS